jgi:hypothetical protein
MQSLHLETDINASCDLVVAYVIKKPQICGLKNHLKTYLKT